MSLATSTDALGLLFAAIMQFVCFLPSATRITRMALPITSAGLAFLPAA